MVEHCGTSTKDAVPVVVCIEQTTTGTCSGSDWLRLLRPLAPVVLATVGTGSFSLANVEYLSPTGGSLAAFIQSEGNRTTSSVLLALRSPAEMLAELRSAFSLNMTETAAVVRVERPTVYAWLRGDVHPHEQNIRRLSALRDLADAWRRTNNETVGNRLRIQGTTGRSLLDLLSAEALDATEIRRMLSSLSNAASEAPREPRVRSAREAAVAMGLDPKRVASGERFDWETGKRQGEG